MHERLLLLLLLLYINFKKSHYMCYTVLSAVVPSTEYILEHNCWWYIISKCHLINPSSHNPYRLFKGTNTGEAATIALLETYFK